MQKYHFYQIKEPSCPEIINCPAPPQPQTNQPEVGFKPNDQFFSNGGTNDQPCKQWSSGLCGCCSDKGECAYALCCPLCYEIRLFRMANESLWSWLWGGLVPFRTKIRTQNNIEGSICGDYCAVMCCGFCSAVQLGIQLRKDKC